MKIITNQCPGPFNQVSFYAHNKQILKNSIVLYIAKLVLYKGQIFRWIGVKGLKIEDDSIWDVLCIYVMRVCAAGLLTDLLCYSFTHFSELLKIQQFRWRKHAPLLFTFYI